MGEALSFALQHRPRSRRRGCDRRAGLAWAADHD